MFITLPIDTHSTRAGPVHVSACHCGRDEQWRSLMGKWVMLHQLCYITVYTVLFIFISRLKLYRYIVYSRYIAQPYYISS